MLEQTVDLSQNRREMTECTRVRDTAKSVWYKTGIPKIGIRLTTEKRYFFPVQVPTCSGKYCYTLFYPMFFSRPKAAAEYSLIMLQLRMADSIMPPLQMYYRVVPH